MSKGDWDSQTHNIQWCCRKHAPNMTDSQNPWLKFSHQKCHPSNDAHVWSSGPAWNHSHCSVIWTWPKGTRVIESEYLCEVSRVFSGEILLLGRELGSVALCKELGLLEADERVTYTPSLLPPAELGNWDTSTTTVIQIFCCNCNWFFAPYSLYILQRCATAGSPTFWDMDHFCIYA